MRLHRLAALIPLALLSCGGGDRPLPTFDAVAYGDCRHQTDVHRRIAAAIVRTRPAFVLVTGDLVDHYDEEPLWAEYREIEKEMRARSEYLCAPGDHDLDEKGLFLKEMGRDRTWYDRRIGDCHVFVLDSSKLFQDRDQVDWIEKTAAASDAPHKLAIFHRPPFTVDPKRLDEADAIRPAIHPLLVRHRFCAAFNGHLHAFYTTSRDGVQYVVTAGGGAPLKGIDSLLGQPGDKARSFHHFVGLTLGPKGIRGRVFDDRGEEATGLAFTVCEHP